MPLIALVSFSSTRTLWRSLKNAAGDAANSVKGAAGDVKDSVVGGASRDLLYPS